MSIRDAVRHAGQLAIAGFAGHSIPSDLRALAREFDLGGIILFARNVAEPEQLAARFAAALAAELRAVGITLDYAPVLDILTNKKNPVIGDRALADTPEGVARLGTAIIRTLQAEGIAACGKHFPGHGDTAADSHDELP